MKNNLIGTSLAGTSTSRERVSNDYYATPTESVESLINVENIKGKVLEPCVGGGHIAKTLENSYTQITGVDIVDRGFPNVIICDFLKYTTEELYDWVVTNPPYKLAQEFIEKSLDLVKDNGKVAMFLKIQFLEGVKRKAFFEQHPPKIIYVFSKRQNPLRNGKPLDEKGNKWNTTMCFAWYVWEKGYKGDTIVKWL